MGVTDGIISDDAMEELIRAEEEKEEEAPRSELL